MFKIKEKLSREEPFLVMNGDIVTKLDFKNILEVHTRKRAEATVGIREFDYRLPFGAVETKKDYITKIEEKPLSHFLINAGIYIFNPQIIELIPENVYFEIPNVITKLVQSKKKVAFYLIKEYWRSIEAIEEYSKALDEIRHWEE